jgi:hypothetical protein
VTGVWLTGWSTAITQPALSISAGRSEGRGADALLRRRLGALVLEVFDRERVVALQHLDAGAALLGDRPQVLAGADPHGDHPAP